MPDSNDTQTVFRSEQFLERYTLLPPVSRRRPYTMSRLAVLPDGTTMPVLRILAREKFGDWDEKEKFPFWIDRNWRNETLENVDLCEVSEGTSQRMTSSYGVPAGTKEYMKRWRAAHPEKVKASQKAYRQRRRLEDKQLRQLAKGFPPTAPVAEEKPSDAPSILDTLESLIEKGSPSVGSEGE